MQAGQLAESSLLPHNPALHKPEFPLSHHVPCRPSHLEVLQCSGTALRPPSPHRLQPSSSSSPWPLYFQMLLRAAGQAPAPHVSPVLPPPVSLTFLPSQPQTDGQGVTQGTEAYLLLSVGVLIITT